MVQVIPIASMIAFGFPLSVSIKVNHQDGVIIKYRFGISAERIAIAEIVKLTGKKTCYIDSFKLNKHEDEIEYVILMNNGNSIHIGSNLYVNFSQTTIGDYLRKHYRIPYEEEVIIRSTNVV